MPEDRHSVMKLGVVQSTYSVLHLWAYLAALPTNPPECSHRVWSRNGREGCSEMLHDVITPMVHTLCVKPWSKRYLFKKSKSVLLFFRAWSSKVLTTRVTSAVTWHRKYRKQEMMTSRTRLLLKKKPCWRCKGTDLRQDPLEAILVIFGRRALIFFCLKALEKNEKWHHFCAHAQWWSPWIRKNVEKGTSFRRI